MTFGQALEKVKSGGKLTGLPTGLSGGTLLVVMGI